MAFWIRFFTNSVTPERTLLHQAGLSDASSSQALWSMPQRFREAFCVSLRASFGHLWNVFLHRAPHKVAVLGGAHQVFGLHVQPTLAVILSAWYA